MQRLKYKIRFALRCRGARWGHKQAVVLAVLLGFGSLSTWAVVQAQAPWPTPPPGPPFPFPDGLELTAPVVSPQLPPESELFVIRPQWPGYTPLIGSVESETLNFNPAGNPSLSLRVEAGTYVETVQIAVSSYAAPREQGGALTRPLLAGFSFSILDKEGAPALSPPRRPVLVSVPVEDLVGQGAVADHLLFVSLDGPAPVLLPTQYHRAEGMVSTRLTEFQTIGIVDVSP